MVMVNPSDGDSWSAQTAHSFPETLTVGKTYMYSAMVKATVINPDFTLQVQDANGGSGEGYVSAATAVDQWIPIEGEFTTLTISNSVKRKKLQQPRLYVHQPVPVA